MEMNRNRKLVHVLIFVILVFCTAVKYNKTMNKIIREKIAEKSRALFNKYGYQKVTMRQIASACGISVGNLTYYYPRKEDLLMLEHDGILNAFLAAVRADDGMLTGMRGYFSVECAFIRRILSDPPIERLYGQVINVPTLRERYCHSHHSLYQSFVDDVPDHGPEWNATIAMCALEFEFADERILMENFEQTMGEIFRTKLMIAGRNPGDYEEDITTGVREGIELSLRLKDVF